MPRPAWVLRAVAEVRTDEHRYCGRSFSIWPGVTLASARQWFRRRDAVAAVEAHNRQHGECCRMEVVRLDVAEKEEEARDS